MNEILWITQVQKDLNDKEITELACPVGTFARLRDRIFPNDNHKKEIKVGIVLVTLRLENGDMADDDPLCIADHHGNWLLKDFFSLPAKVWKKVKVSS